LLGLAAVTAAQAQGVLASLNCGDFKDGIVSPTITDFYDFVNPTLQPGDSVAIRVVYIGTDPAAILTITLVDRNNRTVTARQNSASDPLAAGATFAAEYDLSLDGQYQIKLQNFSNAPISYRVTFTFLNKACAAPALSCGVSQQGKITDVLQMFSYEFPAKAGDMLSARLAQVGTVGKTYDVGMVIYSNAGQQVGFRDTATGGLGIFNFPVTADGSITIVVLDPHNSTGGYVLAVTKINGGCAAKSLACGALLSGNIASPLGTDSYSISNIAAGDVVSIRTAPVNTSSTLVPVVEVYDPQGNRITGTIARQPTLTGRLIVTVTFTATTSAPGSYTVLAEDGATGLNTGQYAITMVRLNRPCPGAQTLPCGKSIDDSLQGLLDTNSYQFAAGANDKFMLRLLSSDPNGLFVPHVDIYDAQGNNLQTANLTSLSPLNFGVAAAGTYTVIMSDARDNSQSGSYSLSLVRVNGACSTAAPALSCGAVAAGIFSKPLDSPEFTYNAAPGQAFSVRLIDETGALQPALGVYDAQGNPVGQPVSGSFVGVDVAKAAGGLYTVVALDNSGRASGAPIGVDLLTPACAATAPQGQTVSGAVSGTRPFDSFSMTASVGDVLSVRAVSFTAGFTAQMDLYDPTGQRVDTEAGQLSRKVSTGGTYTVVVGASVARTGGAYSLAWQLLNNPAGSAPLACGGSAVASLTPANEFRYYTANAGAGDVMRLIFTRLSDNFSPQVELFQPDGTRLAQTSDITQKAGVDGNYLVVVSPSTTNGETGTFNLAYQRPNHPCDPVALTCGQTTLRAVNLPGQLDLFTFTGSGGHQADVKLTQRTGTYSPYVELYDPAGNRLTTSSSGLLKYVLPAGGTYSLLVRDLNAVNTGSYRVALQDDTSACTKTDTEAPVITLVQPTGGEVIVGGTSYHIQWQSDDNVGVATHDVALSTDGGQTFPSAIAAGLSGNAQGLDWAVPPDIAPSRTAVIRVTATDAAGNAQSAASGLLSIIGSGFQPNSTGTFTYDSLNRLTQASYAGGLTIQYTWDAVGNLVGIQVSSP